MKYINSFFLLVCLFLLSDIYAEQNFDWSIPVPKNSKKPVFTPKQRESFFPYPKFKTIKKDIIESRLKKVPAFGIHPRVYITPDDLPEIRNRIKSSKAAKLCYEKLCEETKGFYEKGKEVAKEEVTVLKNKPVSIDEAVEEEDDLGLEEEKTTVFRKSLIEQLYDGSAQVTNLESQQDVARINLTRMLAVNGLRALIDQDQKRGKRAAACLTTYAKLCLERMKNGKTIGLYRPVHYLTLAYDYIAPFMKEKQRLIVCNAIAKSLTQPYKYLDGAMYGVGHPRPSHNWMSLVTQYVLTLALVIEGEKNTVAGVDLAYLEQAIKTLSESATRWVHYFYDESGASFEGLGKCQLNIPTYLALARRGDPLLFHPNVRNFIEQWLPSLMQPWYYQHTVHSGWGGSDRAYRSLDILAYKYIAPKNKKIDLMYRLAVGDHYEKLDALDLIFAVDYDGPKNIDTHVKLAEFPLDHFSPGRAMLNARSSWNKKATWLQFVCDQQYTAHMQTEIGNFLLSSHGKIWSHFIHANDSVGASSYHSVLLIDGIQQKGLGRMIDAKSSSIASFATADTSPAYNQYVKSKTENDSYNDYHPLKPIKAPFASSRDISFNWRHAWEKKILTKPNIKSTIEVKHAYRTTGMVRGTNSYVMIMDDIETVDGEVHCYDWYMQVPHEVVVVSITNKQIKGFEFKDILLAYETDTSYPTENGVHKTFGHRLIKKGKPALLVRLLRSNIEKGRHSPAPGVLETYNNVPSWPNTELRPVGKRLKIQTWAKNPKYMVMLYPHYIGEKVPKTTWEGKNKLQVSFKNQIDLFTFETLDKARPAFTLKQTSGVGSREKTFKLGFEEDLLDALDE